MNSAAAAAAGCQSGCTAVEIATAAAAGDLGFVGRRFGVAGGPVVGVASFGSASAVAAAGGVHYSVLISAVCGVGVGADGGLTGRAAAGTVGWVSAEAG
jgi:hypothetical protein